MRRLVPQSTVTMVTVSTWVRPASASGVLREVRGKLTRVPLWKKYVKIIHEQ